MSDVSTPTHDSTPAPAGRKRGFGWWLGLVLCLGMAIACGVYGLHVLQQRSMTEKIKTMGGTAVVSPIGSSGFVEAMPDFYRQTFTYISAVQLKNVAVTDDLIESVVALPGLDTLHFVDCEIRDAQRDRMRAALPKATIEIVGEYKPLDPVPANMLSPGGV